MEPVLCGGEFTKTSERWSRRPGNFDLLNLKAIFPTSEPSGIPTLAPDVFEPADLVAYNYSREMLRRRRDGSTVHFFLDDYRFESCWTTPQRAVDRIAPFGSALGPDFSVLTWMPPVMQAWQVYRARWVAAYWQWRGVRVIPTVTWATPDTYELCWAGLPRGGALAVSAVGIRDGASRGFFRDGLHHLLRTFATPFLVVYGGLGDLAEGIDLPPFREYPTLQEQRGWRHRAKAGAGAA